MPRATRPEVLIRLLDKVWPDHPVEKMGQEHMVLCPFCDTSKNKLAINANKGVFQCWVCGERGPTLKLLQHLQSLNIIKSADVKAVMTGGTVNRLSDAINTYSNKTPEKDDTLWSVATPCVYPAKVYGISNFSPSNILEERLLHSANLYLEKRGLQKKDIARYRLGLNVNTDSIYRGHIFIPALGPHGRQLVFWTTRAMSSSADPKSLHAGKRYSRFSAKHIMMNEHLITGDEVAFCEGPFDAFSIIQGVGIPAVPLLGKVLHPYHKTVLREKGIKKVYICLDSDATATAEELMNLLQGQGYEVFLAQLEEGDPNDVSHETLRAAFEKATPEVDDFLTSVIKHF